MTHQPDLFADRESGMAETWYIDTAGRVEGPFSVADLHDRAATGQLHPTDSVSSDRLTWVPANTVEGLPFSTTSRQPLLETVVSGSLQSVDSNTGFVTTEKFSPLDSIPGYEVQDTLGTGACGVVFRAVQLKLNRVVALKTVLMPERTPPDILARFDQEAVSLARLQHPNIVAVYDCGHSHGRAYFAMELLDGEDLAARLARTGPLDEKIAWSIARQTAAALAHAAKLGVIHRDVKPANLFLVPPPTGFPLPPDVPMVKVTDFGLALTRDTAGEGDQRQTAAGVIIGTPVYMAPEQFTGKTADIRADIYSLGATMYHMLTGEPPFDGRTVWDVMMKKSGLAPRLQPPVSSETADLVAVMLAQDANERPADYDELIARIDKLPCLDEGRVVCLVPAVVGRRSNPTVTLPAPAPTSLAPQSQAASLRKRWVYAVVAFGLLGMGVGVAALAGVFNRPTTSAPPNYSLGDSESLYDRTPLRWAGRGGGVSVETDVDDNQVLTFQGNATRALKPAPHFQVSLGIDRYKATTVEVVIATSGDLPGSTRWLVRLDSKDGVAFGKQVNGKFEPVGTPIPYPPPKEGQQPYLDLKYQRAGGVVGAWFDTKFLGQTPDDGLKTDELRIEATGGAIRILSADFVELIEQK